MRYQQRLLQEIKPAIWEPLVGSLFLENVDAAMGGQVPFANNVNSYV